jgi:hypothetical protein
MTRPAGPASPFPVDVQSVLSEQRRLQLRFHLRQGLWIIWAPILGLALSILGLVAARSLAQSGQALSTTKVAFLWFGLAYFGLAAVAMATLAFRLRARIVPYFSRRIGDYGGESSTAFVRGRGLHEEASALDERADALGVQRLSSFGFADDFYGQDVRWHSAAGGLATAEALREGPPAAFRSRHPDLPGDLDALATVLRLAADDGVDFCLTVRIFRKDSLQVVSSMEDRQGCFW